MRNTTLSMKPWLFLLIDKNAKWVKAQQDKDEFSLNYKTFSSTIEKDEAQIEQFEVLDNYTSTLSFSSLPYERKKMEADSVLAEKRKRWKKALKKDMYLEEAVYILEDLKLNFISSKPLASSSN